MKKMFFTAIALIAFVGASNAKTGEVKKVNPALKKTLILKERTYCDQLWISYYVYYIEHLHPGSAGSEAAWHYADAWATDKGC